MKNTTFRKKALLSSVAMLLVALVALGSATFAWFTQNPTVNATGLSLQATASAGLQIVSQTEKALGKDYDVSTVINATAIGTTNPNGKTLGTPISLNCDESGVVFYTTQAALETSYEKAASAQISPAAAEFTEILYLRSSLEGGDPVTVTSAKVTISPSEKENKDKATKLYNAIRVTLVDDSSTVIGTWSPDGIANSYLTSTGIAMTTDPETSTQVAKKYTNAYVQGTEATMSKSVGYDTNSYVTMYVWLDGEDDVCKTANVENLKQLVKEINVQFSTK